MKIKLLMLLFAIVSVFSYGQNAPTVYVDIVPPLPVCNVGDATILQADFLQTYATNTNNYTVTSIPFAPAYSFTTGQVITTTNEDDVWSDLITLPFPFCFYGRNYNHVLVGSNGIVSFNIHPSVVPGGIPGGTEIPASRAVTGGPVGGSGCDYALSGTIPSAGFIERNAIYGVFQDTDIRTPPVTTPAIQRVSYYVIGTYPNRAFVANFNELPQFGCGMGVGPQTSQIILYETTNTIDVLVKRRTPCPSWRSGVGVIGVMNQAGTLAGVPPGRNTGNWTTTDEAWRFTPSSSGGSNVAIEWFQGATSLGPGTSSGVGLNDLTVTPTVSTTYTAVATYTRCDGSQVVIQDDVTVGPEGPLPTRNPLNKEQCGTPPFNINENAYMLDTYPAADFRFRYFVDNAGVPGAQIPNATLGAYTPASSVYPQTIWVEIEDQNTNSCTNLRSFTINLVSSPGGTFSYADPFCDSISTPQNPTLTALTSGGVFSASPAGLIIDPTSGAITPNGSTPATYTINYSVPAFGTCPAYAAPPVNVTIVASPVTPTITTSAATCAADGSSTITNYNATQTYTFTPPGPTVGAGGAISGMVAGTDYTVTAGNGTCTSASSATFNNPVMLTTPAIPTITTTPPTCSANGSSTISNYDPNLTYVFNPVGPSVGGVGLITGMIAGTLYSVTAENATCISGSSANFSNPVMLTTPVVPTIATTAATCSADGSSTITNYDPAVTYTFNPTGPTVGAAGAISGMTVTMNYEVTSGNGSCTSAPSALFSNPAMLTTPAVPTVATTAATCAANGSSTITNYDPTLTYTFSTPGPTVGAGGAISGMIAGNNYSVTAGNTNCTSASSALFNNPVMSTTPAVPTVTTSAATCAANGSSTITNYNASHIYVFNPAGPTVGAGGVISGMTAGNNYMVTAGDGTCTSASSATFNNPVMLTTPAVPTITTAPPTCGANGTSTVANYDPAVTYTFSTPGPTVGAGGLISGMIVGNTYSVSAGNASCTSALSASFSNAAMLPTPAVPTITTSAATCSANGSSTITNYDPAVTYVFNTPGPTVGAGGAISGMTAGNNYTVTAGNGSCTSASSATFNNPVMLTTPAVPTITSVPPSCTANGSSTISNYSATLTYTFSPPGPTVGTGGLISGMIIGNSYMVSAGNGSCTSALSASFSNAVMLTTPVVPTTATTPATCTANGSSTITNYNPAQTYTFNPTGPTVGAGGVISGMTAGNNYVVTANNGSCTSAPSAQFNNPVMLGTPAVPTISSAAPTCTANGTSTISNYIATQTYTFTPVGPTVGAGGLISGMIVGNSYMVTAGNGSCTSALSASFSNAAMLPTPVLVITNPATVCAPSTVDLTAPAVTAGSTGGGTLTYWTNAAATTALANPNAVAVGGIYYIKSTSATCSDIEAVTVTINTIPLVTLNSGYVCVDSASGAVLSTYLIDSQLSASAYTFVWTDSLGNTVGNQSSYLATAPGTYSLVATTVAAPFCSTVSANATVQTSSSPQSLSFVTSNYFAETLSIEVTASPAGTYEYQLDGGQYQTSNVFSGVTPGSHIVSVRDIHNVCSPISEQVELVDFPRYFTPNGDGIHDTWNIGFLNSQTNSKVEIFDRMGKLLKVIFPSGQGWDGTYLSQPLPSTDYWFVVHYEEDLKQKIFRGHFAMKR